MLEQAAVETEHSLNEDSRKKINEVIDDLKALLRSNSHDGPTSQLNLVIEKAQAIINK